MKKLVLYSDQKILENKKVDLGLIDLFDKKNPKIGYISPKIDLERKYFNEKIEYYKQYNITDLFYFCLDSDYEEQKIKELLSCDAIHLPGGNTFYLLNALKKRDFIQILRDFSRNGGILIGVSAGGILMSNTINIANIKGYDENSIGINDLSALGLVNFEFFAHLNQNVEWLDEIKKYSKMNKSLIYACNDGDGIIVIGDKIKFFGKVFKIQNGEVLLV